MLDNTSVKMYDMINNTQYIWLYYPLDDALRKCWNITVVSPYYVKNLSGILR